MATRRGKARSILWDRHKVRSGFEKRLKEALEKLGVPFEYETESFKYLVERKYTPDFIRYTVDGKKIYIEAKGRLDSDSKQKLKAMKEQHPDVDLRILFQRNQPIRKGSMITYVDWAKKLGYTCACGETIPEEWFN